MADIIFYTNPQSRGRIVHWMLEELGEPYQIEWIEYGEQIKGEAYRKINPMGKVPAISYKGAVVTEAAAICTYLAMLFPEKGLIPHKEDPRLADFTRWMFFAAAPVEMMITCLSMKWSVPEGAQRTVGFGSFQDVYNALELALQNGPYVCGNQFTAADVYLGSALMWGMQFGTIEKHQSFQEYVSRLIARPAISRANRINDERVALNQR